ncbi:hypothetical protein T439DRAFT_320300 [Meredithblackwellia eburnea MCA 4105]
MPRVGQLTRIRISDGWPLGGAGVLDSSSTGSYSSMRLLLLFKRVYCILSTTTFNNNCFYNRADVG